MTDLQLNARDLDAELAWLARVIDTRMKLHFGHEAGTRSVSEVAPPELAGSESPYARFVRHQGLGPADRLALVLALAAQLRPRLLDVFFTRNATFDRRFTEFGGLPSGSETGFVPTGETLAFLLAGNDLEAAFACREMLDGDHSLGRLNVMARPSQTGAGAGSDEPPSAGKAPLRVSEEWLSLFTTGRPRRPDFGASFPARRIETLLTWDDLVLHPSTRRQVDEIATWLEHGETLMTDWGMAPKLRPGYRSLFYGPPGTGKTMTACLLGRANGRDVYKIDLSLVVSKYVGETEKNLGRVFDQAQSKGWILFFDEADALFGKRGETKDAHDRYANQEVAFLLQRVETFDGIAILASNQRQQIDDAFARRFESMIYFPVPRPEERLRLWRQGFSPRARLEPAVDLARLADEHGLTGGSIMNVIRHVSLQALKRGHDTVSLDDLTQGIRREYVKEGKGT